MLTISYMWIVLAILAGIISAAGMLLNQYFKVPGLLLVLLSRFFTLSLLLPMAFFITWPTSPVYYAAVIVTGLTAGFADIRTYNVTAELGGGVVSRLIPLLVPVTFVTWFIFAPSQLTDYLEAPVKSLGIITALSGCVYFASRLQSTCHISKDALKWMTPTILAYGLNGAMAKLALNNAPVNAGVYGYVFIQTILVIIPTAYYCFHKEKKRGKDHPDSYIPHINKKLLVAAGLASFFWVTHMASKMYAFTLIDNPAYVNAVVLLAPIWIILFYKIIGHKEEANITAGIGILISTIFLVIMTAK